MRIVHVYKDYDPILGGIENHIKMLAEAQVQAGHDVTVLVTNPGDEQKFSTPQHVKLIRASRLTTVASTPLSVDLTYQLAKLSPDITHLHFPYPIGEISQWLMGRKRPYVISYHSDVVKQQTILKLYTPILKRVLANANQIIAGSSNYIQSSNWIRPYAEKCNVIPYAVDIERFPLANKLEEQTEQVNLIFMGRHRYYKGVDDLIRAMTQVNAHLTIGGTGPERTNWEALVQQLNLNEKVTFVGDIPDDVLPQFYAEGDAFVLPANTRAEAFGLVIQEAMSTGLPCVTTELSTGTSWLVRDGESGFVVPPQNPEALAVALNKLVADPHLRQAMGRAGRKRAEEEFTLTTMVAQVEAVYKKVLNGRS